MHLLVIASLLGCAFAGSARTYGAPSFSSHSGGGFVGGSSHGGGFGGVSSHGGGFGGGAGVKFGVSCGNGQIINIDGSCVQPIVTRNVFAYNAPALPHISGPPAIIPPPKVDYNLVFVRTPEHPERLEPIVVPPPQQKTLVYVLNKNGIIEGQKVIEAPSGPLQSPEVFYVNYDEGDNPTLPGGISLQEALSSAHSQKGQVIGGGFGGGVGGGFGGGVGGGFGSGVGSVGTGYGAPSAY